MFKMRPPGKSGLTAGLLGLVFAAATLLWLKLDRAPPNWDDAWYLTNSLTVYDALTQGGFPGYLAKLNSVLGFKAPLIVALPAPFYLLLGRHWHAAFLVNIVSMWVLFAALYRVARRWWSPRAAVFAIAITGTMPLLYGLARWFMVEYALAALVAAAICVLVESERLKRDGHTVLFGALCGFGLLLKVSFPLFVLPALVYVWFTSGRRVRPLLCIALPCLLLAFPWYAGHLRPTLANALDAGFGAPAAIQGTGPIFSLRTIVTYLSHVAASGISYYYVLLALLAGLTLAIRRNKQAAPGLLIAWLLPFAVFVFGGNKDVRYITPMLPAAALVLAGSLNSILPVTPRGTAAGVAILAFPVLQMLAVSFGVPYQSTGGGYARRFSSEDWHHDEILKLIAAHGGRGLLVGADRAALNANNVELTATALQLPFAIETTAHEKDLETLKQRLAQATFFLYKEGGEPESAAFNPYIDDLVRGVSEDHEFQRIPYDRRFPDGGIARIYKNMRPGRSLQTAQFVKGGSPNSDEFAIDFGGVLALTGFSAVTSAGEMAVRLRWRCLRSPDREYWCFTHLIDRSNRIVAQLDHRLLGGQPPLRTWRAGDSGEEEIRLRLPDGTTSAGLRLRFGIYDPPSGDRLRIGPLPPSVVPRFSLADQDTALLAPN
jgi:4-amino-4-deoxy-L-arabinose transferase-like glycosyltransferase